MLETHTFLQGRQRSHASLSHGGYRLVTTRTDPCHQFLDASHRRVGLIRRCRLHDDARRAQLAGECLRTG